MSRRAATTVTATGLFLAAMSASIALTPAPAPPPPSPKVVEAYIACYPKVEVARERYRAEVRRLEAAFDKEKGALPAAPPGAIDLNAYHGYRAVKEQQVYARAADRVFLPVLRGCGFDSVDAYALANHAIRFHFEADHPSVAPYRAVVDGMRLPNYRD